MLNKKVFCLFLASWIGGLVFISLGAEYDKGGQEKYFFNQDRSAKVSYTQMEISFLRERFEINTLKYVDSYLIGLDKRVGHQRGLIRATQLLDLEYFEHPYYADVIRCKLKIMLSLEGGYESDEIRNALEMVSIKNHKDSNQKTFSGLVSFVCARVANFRHMSPSAKVNVWIKEYCDYVEKNKEYLNVSNYVLNHYEEVRARAEGTETEGDEGVL